MAKGIRVLIVDDDLSIRRLLRKVMELIGVEDVIITNEGKSALVIFNEMNPDIVFADYVMPEMDGLELLEAIKSRSPEKPVVIYTGKYDKRLIDKIEEAKNKPDFALQKPNITMEKLANIMDECFPEQEFRKKYRENIQKIIKENDPSDN